ncbi:hypothetical protein CJ194_23695 [Priestia megaterium]|uniref:hypothetical protein n=1 Tax=Priestia megaterium TaxID=1404 RepID=UPI000C804657|nr:hypothetical protein [Priestia megaterium]PMD07608.1 hypothetical protein CJ194_23695 [Priestia megaterium]
MFYLDQLIAFMEKTFDVAIELNEVGGEIISLYHEEIDEKIISKNTLQILTNPVLFQTYVYNEKSEWIIGVVLHATTNDPLFLVCLKNGEKVYEKLLNTEKYNNE